MIRSGSIGLLSARARTARASERNRLVWKLLVVLAALATGAVAAFSAHSASAASAVGSDVLIRARAIRAEINARSRITPGRRLVVTEATSTGVVRSITLVTDWLEPPRVVPADNGIYFAICSRHTKCPYPARSAAWPSVAFLPRRLALELALRTLLQTSASVVVVALPTVRPVWVVFERDDLLAEIDAAAALDQLGSSPLVINPALRKLIDQLTRPRLFVPLLLLPPPDETIYAVQLFGG